MCLLDTAAPPAVARQLSAGQQSQRGWRTRTLPNRWLRLGSALNLRGQLRAPLVDGFHTDGAIKLGLTYNFCAGDAPLHLFASRAHQEKLGSGSLGWIDVHRGPVEVHEILGDHKSMIQQPRVSAVAAAVATSLREAQSAAMIPPV